MILVDSSVWIEYFRGNEKTLPLNELIDTNSVCMNDLILAELLPSINHKKEGELREHGKELYMIVDRFSQIELYASVHPDIPELLKALQEIDPATADPGKYPVPGTDSFFMIQRYETRNQQKGIWEAHRKFIDLQYVVSGEELIGYQDIENLQEDTPYSEEKDAAFYRGAGTMVPVKAGTFMLLYPHDGHMPGIEIDEPGSVIKVVAKLPAVSVS